MDTDMRHAAYPDEDRTKLKSPFDVLDAFLYLASDQSYGVTGQSFDAQDFQQNKKEHA